MSTTLNGLTHHTAHSRMCMCARAYIHDGQASCTVRGWSMHSRPTWCHLVQWPGPSRVQNWSCQSSTQVLPVSADWMCSSRTNDSHSSLQACVRCAAHTLHKLRLHEIIRSIAIVCEVYTLCGSVVCICNLQCYNAPINRPTFLFLSAAANSSCNFCTLPSCRQWREAVLRAVSSSACTLDLCAGSAGFPHMLSLHVPVAGLTWLYPAHLSVRVRAGRVGLCRKGCREQLGRRKEICIKVSYW